jgi:YVTN family beta-propeller protein
MRLPLEGRERGQIDVIRDLYRTYRGSGTSFRQQLDKVPVALFITLLEIGYRVALVADVDGLALRFEPDGSSPRDRAVLGEGSAAHSLVATSAGSIYSTTSKDRVAVLDASTRRIRGHVSVGRNPQHLAVSDKEDRVYSANLTSDDVTVIDTADDSVVATSGAGRWPMLPCPGRSGHVWVPSRPDGSVAVLGADGARLASIPVGSAPHDLAISPDGRWAYQPNSVSGTVTVIDARAMRAIGDVKVGVGPCHAEFTPDSDFAFVTNTVSNEISVIRTADHEVTANIVGGSGPHVPVISHDGRWGYVANFVSDDITIFDVGRAEVVAVVPVGTYPHAMSLSPDGRRLVVSNTGTSTVCLLDTATRRVRATLEVGGAPAHAAFDPDGRLAFIACEVDDQVSVIDLETDRLIDRIFVGTATA